MEAGIMEELKVCREERDILRQKLHIHLDRWTLDKIMFDDMTAKAAREVRLKEAQLSYETARRDMRLGSQQQQLLLLKLKLDSAMEDMELKEIQFSALKSQLLEERKGEHSVSGKLKEMEASISKKAEKKVYHLQKLLDDCVASHKAKVSRVEGKHALAVTLLREEIKHLVSREDMKAQQMQWSIERRQLQALARERDDLRAEQEQWHRDRQELSAVLQDRESLRSELAERKSQQNEMQGLKEEKDLLTADKERRIALEQEMEELLTERDRLSAQLEDIQELTKEREKLKQELDLSNGHRQDEVKALVRERDFVWSQMKNLDEDYGKRIKKMSEQTLQDRQEIERLSYELKGAQVSYNELMVETTILKLEVKRVDDQAIEKQRASEAELQALQFRLEKMKEEKQTLIADAEKRDSRLLELISRKEALERRMDFSYPDQGAAAVADGAKEGPEVLNAGDGLVLDHNIIESQIDEATQAHRTDEKKSARSAEDLRRENENLRRETENLRILYAELEDALRKKTQKPAKVAQKGNHRDPTSRNLKLELEAAATCCPSDESPLAEGNVLQNVSQKKRDLGKQQVASNANLPQKTSKGASSKSGREESHFSEHVEVSQRKDRSSKTVCIFSPKNLRRKSRVDYSDAKISAVELALGGNEIKSVKKRKKKGNGDVESTRNQRPPRQALPRNRRSSIKSAVRTASSNRGPLPESETKILSPSKTSKMMSNLFSTAFSVPKLKNAQTPSHLMT